MVKLMMVILILVKIKLTNSVDLVDCLLDISPLVIYYAAGTSDRERERELAVGGTRSGQTECMIDE